MRRSVYLALAIAALGAAYPPQADRIVPETSFLMMMQNPCKHVGELSEEAAEECYPTEKDSNGNSLSSCYHGKAPGQCEAGRKCTKNASKEANAASTANAEQCTKARSHCLEVIRSIMYNQELGDLKDKYAHWGKGEYFSDNPDKIAAGTSQAKNQAPQRKGHAISPNEAVDMHEDECQSAKAGYQNCLVLTGQAKNDAAAMEATEGLCI
eukprot:TRINITY_DN352_c0_g1_i1.p2 TRINITY_DN352_c0_g1~~TRINITY_DN352_c0_g1_i1.p2  ORF type:complete len:210 (+),score=50.91 TRINITY_DN352_c0_g1_i1:256-885(+)